MNKYVYSKQKMSHRKKVIGMASLTLCLITVGMSAPSAVHAANNVGNTVSTQIQQFHVRFVDRNNHLVYEENAPGILGKGITLSQEGCQKLSRYTLSTKKAEAIIACRAPEHDTEATFYVFPRVTHEHTSKSANFIFNCHFTDRPIIVKNVTVPYNTEIITNYFNNEVTLKNIKIANYKNVNGDELVLPTFTGYKLSPQSLQRVKVTNVMKTASDFEGMTEFRDVGPFDLYFIHENVDVGESQTDPEKSEEKTDSEKHTDTKEEVTPQRPGNDDQENDASVTDKKAEGKDSDQSAGTSSPSDKTNKDEDSTQTNGSDKKDTAVQTEHSTSSHETQTDERGQIDEGTQTNVHHKIDEQTQTEDIQHETSETQTKLSDQTNEGTQTDSPVKEDVASQTDNTETDNANQTEGKNRQDSTNQTQIPPKKEEESQTDGASDKGEMLNDKKHNDVQVSNKSMQTPSLSIDDRDSQKGGTSSVNKDIQTDLLPLNKDGKKQTSISAKSRDNEIKTDNKVMKNDNLSPNESQIDFDNNSGANINSQGINYSNDTVAEKVNETVGSDHPSMSVIPERYDGGQVNSPSPEIMANSLPSAKDDPAAGDLAKINELNQMPLPAADSHNDHLPQTGNTQYGIWALFVGFVMAAGSMLGLTKRQK